jgi:hypothetical protein
LPISKLKYKGIVPNALTAISVPVMWGLGKGRNMSENIPVLKTIPNSVVNGDEEPIDVQVVCISS